MTFLKWSDEYSVGVREIDVQHKKLFEMLTVFYANVKTSNKNAIMNLTDQMIKYAQFHFETEEYYFEKFSYEEAEKHKKQHEDFLKKAKETKEKIENGKLVISMDITGFLKDWLLNHIKISDRKYIECFIKNGLVQ